MKELLSEIDPQHIPQHIAVIMDGNGRWGEKHGKQRIFGHENATKSIREITGGCLELGIPYLTLFAFSTENWQRAASEVDAIMRIGQKMLQHSLSDILDTNIRLSVIGDTTHFPVGLQNALQQAVERSTANTGLLLTVALGYSGRWDVVQAAQTLAKKVQAGRLQPEQIDATSLRQHLSTGEIPDPDLLIRTGGQLRVSNFLLYQMAYTEFIFLPDLWPDMRKKQLYEAIITYQKRNRKFGK